MPKSTSEKCRLCSKLSAEEAIAKHGPFGTGCWIGEPCHKRRSYYRNRGRYNISKRQQYRVATGQASVVVKVAAPAVVYGLLVLYRARVDAPLHAMGAELWKGEQKLAEVEVVHTLGWKPAQVQGYLHDILKAFAGQAGETLEKYEVQQERSPGMCPVCGG